MSVEPLKESHQNLSFQKSKNPKIPTQVSDFWKLEEFAQNPKNPKFLEFPKIQKSKPQFRIFGNSRNLLKIQKNQKFLEFPKFQKSKNPNPSFGFLETRGICSKSKKTQNSSRFQKSKNPNPSFGFLETRGICSKSKKTQNSSSFQKSKNPKTPTPVSDFWKLEEFAQNPKNPKFLEFPKIRNWGWDFWIFGFLETRGILGFFEF